jgi:hypothetical protein
VLNDVASTSNDAHQSNDKPKPIFPIRALQRLWQWWTNPFRSRGNFPEHMTVVVSVIIAIIAFLQWNVYRQQKEIMKSSGQQTQKLIDAAEIQADAAKSFANSANNINTGIGTAVDKLNLQAHKLGEGVTQTARLASATEKANDNVINSDRPWIGFTINDIDIRHEPPNVPRTQGRFYFTVNYVITNYGPSTALNVASEFQTVSMGVFVPDWTIVCQKAERTSLSDGVEPENYFRRSSVFQKVPINKSTPDTPDMSFTFEDPFVHVIGCIAYRGIGGDKTHFTRLDFTFSGTTLANEAKFKSEKVYIRNINAQ